MASNKKASTEIDVDSQDESVNKFTKMLLNVKPNQLDNYVLQPPRDSARNEIMIRAKRFMVMKIIS